MPWLQGLVGTGSAVLAELLTEKHVATEGTRPVVRDSEQLRKREKQRKGSSSNPKSLQLSEGEPGSTWSSSWDCTSKFCFAWAGTHRKQKSPFFACT